MAEKEQVTREKEQLMTEKNQLQQELQTANTRRAGEWIQQLQQQVSDINVTSSYKYHCYCSSSHQLLVEFCSYKISAYLADY